MTESKIANLNLKRTFKEGDIVRLEAHDLPVGREMEKLRPYIILHCYPDGDMCEVAPIQTVDKHNPRYKKETPYWAHIQVKGKDEVVLFNQRNCVSSERFQEYYTSSSEEDLLKVLEKHARLHLDIFKKKRTELRNAAIKKQAVEKAMSN